jgi:hypothetical protein
MACSSLKKYFCYASNRPAIKVSCRGLGGEAWWQQQYCPEHPSLESLLEETVCTVAYSTTTTTMCFDTVASPKLAIPLSEKVP